MKTQFSKLVITAAFGLAMAFNSASAQGLYFDAGFGVGPGTTKFDGKDFVDLIKSLGGNVSSDIGVDIGFKFGYGPIAGSPIYVVGVFNGIGHRIDESSDYVQFNSYLIGPGIILYPASPIQLGASIGTSWVANTTNISGLEFYDSDGGFAWDISAAVDLGNDKHACLLGVKYFGAHNTLKVSKVKQESSVISIFVRYAFRHKNGRRENSGYENDRYRNDRYENNRYKNNRYKNNKSKNDRYKEDEDDEYEDDE